MPEHIETIPCRRRNRKGVIQLLPERPIDLRPGDWAERVTIAGRTSIVIHRVGFWKRTRAKWRERRA
jgi:hypothetical protein